MEVIVIRVLVKGLPFMINDILSNLNILFMNLISKKKLNLADLFTSNMITLPFKLELNAPISKVLKSNQ